MTYDFTEIRQLVRVTFDFAEIRELVHVNFAVVMYFHVISKHVTETQD